MEILRSSDVLHKYPSNSRDSVKDMAGIGQGFDDLFETVSDYLKEVSVKWILNQASHGFWAWAENLRGQGLRRWNECEKNGEPRTRGIFSGGWASIMEIPGKIA